MVVGSSRKMMIVVWISIKTAIVIVESSDISGQWTFLHEITKYDESYQGLLFHLLRNLWIETPDFSSNSPKMESIRLGPWRCTGSITLVEPNAHGGLEVDVPSQKWVVLGWTMLIFQGVHSGRLTWNLKTTQWQRKIIFQTIIFRVHVNFPMCSVFVT